MAERKRKPIRNVAAWARRRAEAAMPPVIVCDDGSRVDVTGWYGSIAKAIAAAYLRGLRDG
jgi:hypothetical protein